MRAAGVICIGLALVAFLARGWGLAGLDGTPGLAPFAVYRWASIFALPVALVLLVVGATLYVEGGRRARGRGKDECS